MPQMVLETEIKAPIEDCFNLSLSVDAHLLSMSRSAERAVAGVTEGGMRLGQTVTWQARHFGIPFRMTSKITAYDSPRRFVDEQVHGPFAEWWHEHRFQETEFGSVMTDLIRYGSPAGPLGRLADLLFLEGYLRALIQRRNAWLKTELESGP